MGYFGPSSISTDLRKQFDISISDANDSLAYYDIYLDKFLPNTESDEQALFMYIDKENAENMKEITFNPGSSSDSEGYGYEGDEGELVTVKIDR